MGASANSMIFGNAASEATLATLSQSGELRRYRALLFATHGLAAGSTPSEEPAISLTPGSGCDEHVAATTKDTDDGLRTASEITMLSLDAGVVVLSGCNTASGDASGASYASALTSAMPSLRSNRNGPFHMLIAAHRKSPARPPNHRPQLPQGISTRVENAIRVTTNKVIFPKYAKILRHTDTSKNDSHHAAKPSN